MIVHGLVPVFNLLLSSSSSCWLNLMLLIHIQDGASQITMTDLREEAQDEVSKSGGKGHPFGMYT